MDVAMNASDSTSILQFVKASEAFIYNRPTFADTLNQLGLQKSRDLKLIRGIEMTLINLSSTAIVQGNYDLADGYLDEVLELVNRLDRPQAKINALNRRSIVQYYRGEYLAGIETNLTVLDLLEEYDDPRSRINAYNNIGINYERLEDNEKALEYYGLAREGAMAFGNAYLQAAIAANIGVIEKNLGHYARAKQLFIESIDLAKEIDNKSLLIDEMSNLAEVHSLEHNYELAYQTISEVLPIASDYGDKNGMIKAYSQQGKILYFLNQFADALTALRQAQKLAEESGDREELLSIYEYLHKSYHANGQTDRAYTHANLFSTLRDSIFDFERTAEVERLEASFQLAQKDKEILTQQLELERRTRQRNLYLGGAIVLAILGLWSYLLLRKINRDQRKIAAQTQLLQQQKIESLENEQKILVLDAMVNGQEEERKRIAHDLHDSVGSLMATIKGYYSALEQKLHGEEQGLYEKTDQLIDHACEEIRRISHNMMPAAITEIGLDAAVLDLLADYQQAEGWIINHDLDGLQKPVPESLKVTFYRILQELLNNAAKHAEATEIDLRITTRQDLLVCRMGDNGRGFDPAKVVSQDGLGLKSIRSRIEYLGGDFEITSAPGEGTEMLIRLPLEETLVR